MAGAGYPRLPVLYCADTGADHPHHQPGHTDVELTGDVLVPGHRGSPDHHGVCDHPGGGVPAGRGLPALGAGLAAGGGGPGRRAAGVARISDPAAAVAAAGWQYGDAGAGGIYPAGVHRLCGGDHLPRRDAPGGG